MGNIDWGLEMLRWMTAGESHGQALVATIEGIPAGVTVTSEELQRALARRRSGYGRGSRQGWEQDRLRILGGVRHGVSLGSPIVCEIENSEWPKWRTVMSPDPVEPADLRVDAGRGDSRELARNKPLTRPRPGHADFAGMLAYGFDDAREVLERASARETAARVVLGTIAELFLRQAGGIELVSHVVAVGEEKASVGRVASPGDAAALDESVVRALDESDEDRFIARIDRARAQGDTVGGVVEVVAWNVPVGLGTHTVAHERLDARLAAALMSIQSVKGVEIGDGFALAGVPGSSAHDEFDVDESNRLIRLSNRAGGVEGGLSNGQPLIVRAAFKPISTVGRALRSVDLATGESSTAIHQRSDTCQVVPGAVIAQAEVALVLADALLVRTGGYSVDDVRRHLEDYRRRVAARLSWEGQR